MRSVNLIPPEEQRGDRAPMRTGVFTYVLIGGLALLLLGIVAVTLTSKQISDRKAEKANLEQELAQETARAQSLAAFINFRTVEENRATTLTTLSNSRFDWSRVLHELSLVLPSDIRLVSVTGTVSPEVEVEDAEAVTLRSGVSGPALEITGCAPSQDSVAGFVSSLEDIDGVTRVGLDSSGREHQDPSEAGAPTETQSQSTEDSSCNPNTKPYDFALVAAFDAVTLPSAPTAGPSAPAPAAPAPAGGGGGGGTESQVADGYSQNAAQASSVKQQTDRAKHATNALLPGG
jgi:Tfp pilus assembly protein PilN